MILPWQRHFFFSKLTKCSTGCAILDITIKLLPAFIKIKDPVLPYNDGSWEILLDKKHQQTTPSSATILNPPLIN